MKRTKPDEGTTIFYVSTGVKEGHREESWRRLLPSEDASARAIRRHQFHRVAYLHF
jgi:hypothetical protein